MSHHVLMRAHTPPRSAIAVCMTALLAVTLTACGNDSNAASPAESGRIAESALSLGIAPELVYMTDVDGYDLAVQSVGPYGSAGLQASWFAGSTGATLTMRTEEGELSAETCPATPLEDAVDAVVTCDEDESGLWHRSAGDSHEYVTTRGGVLIRVTGTGAPPEDLRAAARAAHVPSVAELELLFSDAPQLPSAPPVERGDLPENGDGAPGQPTGPGG